MFWFQHYAEQCYRGRYMEQRQRYRNSRCGDRCGDRWIGGNTRHRYSKLYIGYGLRTHISSHCLSAANSDHTNITSSMRGYYDSPERHTGRWYVEQC